MVSAFIFNTTFCFSHTIVALHSDPSPCWVQQELRNRRLTAELELISANKPSDKRRRLNDSCHKTLQREHEERKGSLRCIEDEGFRIGTYKDEESPKALQEEGGEEREAIFSEDKPHVSHISAGGNVALVGLLKACSDKKDLQRGNCLHSDIIKRGALKKNVFIGSSLVNLYAKCGALEEAQLVFDELPAHSLASWNALIGGYVQYEQGEDALDCYDRMEFQGISPNIITFLCILKACGSAGTQNRGEYVHSQIMKAGFLEDACVGTALIDMYFKCGLIVEAQKLFDCRTYRDVVSWTALIQGYTQHECGEEALQCFEQMQLEGFSPDAITSACILNACGSIGVAYEGQRLHAEFVLSELLEKDMVAGSALLDMYANCGMLAEAREVFDNLPVRNVVPWSALMKGYAQLGNDEIVFSLFEKMIGEGTKPSWITFTIVLNACCHRGLLEKAKTYFQLLSKFHGIVPTIEHHACIVDLFCRAGHLDQAMAVIEEMPTFVNSTVWHSLLDACQRCGNRKIGRWAFGHVLKLGEKDAGAYVCLSNFPASRQYCEDKYKTEL